MKRIIIFLSVIFSFSLAASAQEVGRFEFELGYGGAFPIQMENHPAYNGRHYFGEVRYNLNSKFDLGLNISDTRFIQDDVSDKTIHQIHGLQAYLCFDYNWRRAKEYNIFVGLGAGWTVFQSNTNYYGLTDGTGSKSIEGSVPCFAPRVGIELFDRLRLSYSLIAPYDCYELIHSTITIGLVFGGKRK